MSVKFKMTDGKTTLSVRVSKQNLEKLKRAAMNRNSSVEIIAEMCLSIGVNNYGCP